MSYNEKITFFNQNIFIIFLRAVRGTAHVLKNEKIQTNVCDEIDKIRLS
jgi:hypothetical protein